MCVIERGVKTPKLDTFDASPMHWAYLQMHFCRTVLTMPMKASRLRFLSEYVSAPEGADTYSERNSRINRIRL